MALKDMMLGTAIAALIAGGAVAQDTNTQPTEGDAPAVEEMEQSDGDTGASTETTAETEAQDDMSTGETAETETEDGMSTESTAETDTGTDMETDSADGGMGSDTDTAADDPATTDGGSDMEAEAPDAGSEMAAESEAAEAPSSLSEMTVGQVVGTSVLGVDNEDVGEVDYVIAQGDSVSFVIGIGGFLGLGEYTVALPADQFSLNADGELKLSSMTRADLEQQPEFDESEAESLPDDMRIGDLS